MMVDPAVLAAFLPLAVLLNLTPGADMMFCLGQGLSGGRTAAIAASAGVSAGVLANVALAGLGLGAAVAAVPAIFEVIRWVGVAYLGWLALRALRTTGTTDVAAPVRSTRRAFRDGFFVNVSNPKVILFVLALLPQFVDPTQGRILVQFLALGCVIAAGGFFINGLVGWFAGHLARMFTSSPRADRIFRWGTATIFGGLALKLATEPRA